MEDDPRLLESMLARIDHAGSLPAERDDVVIKKVWLYADRADVAATEHQE
jgi:hypothetical protein